MKALVVGGGITGLAAAYAFAKAGADVTLAERSRTLGGKISTERACGLLIEHGPDSFLTLRPAALALCGELGLADDVVSPRAPDTVFVWHDGRLVPIPPGAGLGIPTRFVPFLASPLFSPCEKLRAAAELVVPPDRAAGDVAIGAFLRRRYGDAIVDRLAGPLVSAIYGAGVDELSLDALMPRLREAAARHGGLIRAGLAARRAPRVTTGPAVVTLRGGMSALVSAIGSSLGRTDVLFGADVARIERAGTRYVAHLADGRSLIADAVVLAAPAAASARMLADLAPRAAEALAAIVYRGTVAVTLAYDASQLARPLAGHGVVVPEGSLPIAACTLSSAKWPGRAADGVTLVRATIRSDALLERADADLVDMAHRAVSATLGVDGVPQHVRVTRWLGAMPRYTVGHVARVSRIEASLADLRGLTVAGAAYRGSGVPDCIAQGQAAAERILATEQVAA